MNEVGFTIEELKARSEDAWTKAFKCLSWSGRGLLKRLKFAKNWPLQDQDFEEFIDDALCDSYEKIGTIGTLEELKSYFLIAAKHHAIDRIRQEKARRRGKGQVLVTSEMNIGQEIEEGEETGKSLTQEIDPEACDWTALNSILPETEGSPVSEAQITESRLLLRAVLENLDKKDRLLIECWFYEKLKHKEIADRMNQEIAGGRPWTANRVGNEIDRAVERLGRKIPLDLKRELKGYGRKAIRP